MSLRIAVLGGGIGGLAAAGFLHRAGLNATVLRAGRLPDGPEQRARDGTLAGEDPRARNAWIYGHDPEPGAAEPSRSRRNVQETKARSRP
jgi:glycine/D-amino acid oxidase-like deaminating enzyme